MHLKDKTAIRAACADEDLCAQNVTLPIDLLRQMMAERDQIAGRLGALYNAVSGLGHQAREIETLGRGFCEASRS